MKRIIILVALAACADQPYDTDDASRTCDAAAGVLAECGHATEDSPFGTCQPEQHAAAEKVMAIYNAGGCAAISDAKADGPTCSSLPFLCVQHTVGELAPFTTDGCTMFPDGSPADVTLWQHCCIEHDFAYYLGGPSEAREAADTQLRACVAAAANQAVADVMYYGVRVGGTPVLPTPWRWGYGWKYDPLDGYRTIAPAFAAAAAAQLDAYRAHPLPPDALEQRLLALASDIRRVPGLQAVMDQLAAIVRDI